MATRLELHTMLEKLLRSGNVYYNPPTNLTMKYDAIRYSLSSIQSTYANDAKYSNMKRYDLVVISKHSDPIVVDRILELPYSSFNTHYKSDNLNHYSITLYW